MLLFTLDNSVRLVDGNAQEGNIQIFLNDNWNYICDRNWELTTANSLCEMLGFEGAIALTKFNFYNSTQTGQPISFLECTPECVSQDCVVAEIAGVMCGDLREFTSYLRCENMINHYSVEYEVRLVGSDLPTMGRAQIFYNGRWLEFCQDLSSFFLQNGPTICNQLGYGYERTFGSTEGREMFGVPDTNGTISALCFGTRSKVEDCSLSFFPCTNHGLYIACTPPGKVFRDYLLNRKWQGKFLGFWSPKKCRNLVEFSVPTVRCSYILSRFSWEILFRN